MNDEGWINSCFALLQPCVSYTFLQNKLLIWFKETNQQAVLQRKGEEKRRSQYLKAASLAGRAGYHASSGEYEKAADLYLSAAKISKLNAENPNYLLNAGIYYLQIGNEDEAKALFDEIKNNYGTSMAGREISKYLAQIQ